MSNADTDLQAVVGLTSGNFMDVSNEHLKYLLEQTDIAFNALRQQPESAELSSAYEQARLELDNYVATMRNTLSQRQYQR